MGHPYRDLSAGDASDESAAPPERGPFDTGPLHLPHYALTLIPGCAMMSVERGDTWIVRLEYDPARQTGAFDDKGNPVFALDPVDSAVMPPLIAAFGDPGESRASVEQAFLDALCEAWCAIVRRFTAVGPDSFSNETFDELEHADIWVGNQDSIDHSLLCMVGTALSIYGFSDTHSGRFVTETAKREFWKRKGRGIGFGPLPDERTYFREQIKEWREQTFVHHTSLNPGIF